MAEKVLYKHINSWIPAYCMQGFGIRIRVFYHQHSLIQKRLISEENVTVSGVAGQVYMANIDLVKLGGLK